MPTDHLQRTDPRGCPFVVLLPPGADGPTAAAEGVGRSLRNPGGLSIRGLPAPSLQPLNESSITNDMPTSPRPPKLRCRIAELRETMQASRGHDLRLRLACSLD